MNILESKKEPNIYWKYWIYILAGVVSIGVHIVLAYYVCSVHTDKINKVKYAIELEENEKMNDGILSINQYLDMQSHEASFLAKQIKSLNTLEIERFCTDFMESNTEFIQLRILTEQGDETFRLCRKEGVITTIPRERFQNKSDRSYFKKAIEIDEFKIYHSGFTMDMEYGKPLEPRRVTLRHYSPFIRNGEKYLVGLNWDYKKLFSSLAQRRLFLLNENQVHLHGNIAKLYEWVNIDELTTSLSNNFLIISRNFETHTGQLLTIGSKRGLKGFNLYKASEENSLYILWGCIFLSGIGACSLIYAIARKRNEIESENKYIDVIKSNAERFNRWMNSNFIGIIQSSASGGIKDANNTLLAMLGYSRQDLLEGNLDWAKLTPPEFHHLDENAMKEATDKGFWTPFEKEYIHKDGHRVPIIIGGSLFKETPDEYIVFVIDISERKRMSEKFEKVFNISPDLVGMGSLDGYFTQINFSFKRIFGYEDKEFLGRPFVEFIHEDDVESTLEVLDKAIEEKHDLICQNRYRCKNGSYKWIEWNSLAVAEEHIFYTTGRDITERKKAEKRLKAQHAITQLLSESITHEEVSSKILQLICEVLEWDIGEVWEYDQEGEVLFNTEIWHIPSFRATEFMSAGQINFAPKIGLPGQVWDKAKPIWIADVVYDTNFPRSSAAAKDGLHGAFGFPIIIGNEVLGTICFYCREIREPDNELLDMMMSVGQQIGFNIKRKQSEEKTKNLAKFPNENPNPVLRVERNGTILFANNASSIFLDNWDTREGQSVPEDWHKHILESLRSDTNNNFESECNAHIFSITLAPVAEEGYVNFYGIDITERKLAEKELMASENKMRAWLENSPVCTKILDLDFNLQFMSSAGIKGLKIEDINSFYGKPYPFDFYPESFRNTMTRNLEKVKESGSIITQEAQVVDIDGNELWFNSTLLPVIDDKNHTDYIIIVSLDVTKRKQAEETLIQSEKLRAMGMITAGIAHDFNNILAIISGITQVLEMNNEDNKELMDGFRTIIKASDDGAEIVHRMSMFARQEKETSGLLPVSIKEVLIHSLEFVKPRWMNIAKAGGIDYRIEDAGIMEVPIILGNESELREVFINIMNNAMDAMGKGGCLTLRTWQDEWNIFISISDTGEGMSEDVRKRVFEPFYTTKREKGSGLGMSMSYGIVESYGGSIEVESVVENGSTFTLRLPIAVLPVQQKESSVEDLKIKVKGLSILVIDDMKDIRSLLEGFFTNGGHTVKSAEGGNMAIELIKMEAFDIVLCDLVMPDISGYEVIEVMNRIEKRPKIGLMTGWSERIETEDHNDLNVDFIIKKPFKLAELTKHINELF
ncbi:MAG: PAS domain S-box protein, partial [Candidatus Brocadiaceae bacterium]|nr:PAS domain S-box protein [Candidatus Brocadiaceae bacterium]